jgi:hypothetical protein
MTILAKKKNRKNENELKKKMKREREDDQKKRYPREGTEAVVVDCLQTTTEGGYRKSILLDCCGNKLWTCNREPQRVDDADSISPLYCLLNCLDPRHTTAHLHGCTELFWSLALAQTPLAIPFPSREATTLVLSPVFLCVRHLSSRIFFFPIAYLALGRQQNRFKFFLV